ncbi:MAG: hypothetical protein LC104_06865 [Bacteroidales bacterium]|nr:hypothetical protein [Bacteroidales bacterium]
MKKLLFTAFALLTLTATSAMAGGGSSPFGAGQHGQYPNEGFLSYMFHNRPVPTFQAAPWYLYWPYNAHFMTPAPLGSPYMAPPGVGGAMMNPYFPHNPGYMVQPGQ